MQIYYLTVSIGQKSSELRWVHLRDSQGQNQVVHSDMLLYGGSRKELIQVVAGVQFLAVIGLISGGQFLAVIGLLKFQRLYL